MSVPRSFYVEGKFVDGESATPLPRIIKKSAEKTTSPQQGCDTLPPELAEAVRFIVREELKKDRQHRRRALLAEVDSINRELSSE